MFCQWKGQLKWQQKRQANKLLHTIQRCENKTSRSLHAAELIASLVLANMWECQPYPHWLNVKSVIKLEKGLHGCKRDNFRCAACTDWSEEEEKWRKKWKREIIGVINGSTFWQRQGTWWALEMSGDSPISAIRTVEVRCNIYTIVMICCIQVKTMKPQLRCLFDLKWTFLWAEKVSWP